jgi:hypothetical protein
MNGLRVFGKAISIKPSKSKRISHDEKFSFDLPTGGISPAEYPRLKPAPKIRNDVTYQSDMLYFNNAPPNMTVQELIKVGFFSSN